MVWFFARPIFTRKIPIPQQSQRSGPQAVSSETKLAGALQGAESPSHNHLSRATQTCFRSLQHPCLVAKCTTQHLWAASGPAWDLAPLPAIHAGRHCRHSKKLSPIKYHQNGLPKPPSLHQPRAPLWTNRGSYPGLPSPRRHMHDDARSPSGRCSSCMRHPLEAFKSPSLSF
jgi:hypothetical protein